jgi:hypothetical protein
MAAARHEPGLPEDEVGLWIAMQRGLMERKELLTQQLEHIQVLRKQKQGGGGAPAFVPPPPPSLCVNVLQAPPRL